jgi:predicted RNA-binding Zn-ribbon protein involved in translation (DUF1610 family)
MTLILRERRYGAMAYRAGEESPEAGVYRCTNCGAEITLEAGAVFPPCECGLENWSIVRRT